MVDGRIINLQEDFQIQHIIIIGKSDFNIPTELLPKQFVNGVISVAKKHRCSIEYGKKENGGGYGIIYRAVRTPSKSNELCVKAPHNSAHSLCSEAILQWMANQTLEAAGIVGAIPRIYDIFQYAGETRFSMDFIQGVSAVKAVAVAKDPDTLWLQILSQVSMLLGYLEETIHLDHRDLKADNLWIRAKSVHYTLIIGGYTWHIKAPFQVVILDFGFACLGGKDGNAIVSLSDGIVPRIDPCPKDGRDLFQLITSMWSIPEIRARASESVHLDMDVLLTYKTASYMDIVQRTIRSHWIYLAVSDIEFRHPPLHPLSLLLKLSRDWSIAGLYHE